MDNADIAQSEIDYALLERMFATRRMPQIEPTGVCLNCGETLTHARRWCDAGCRDDWSRLGCSQPD